GENRSPARRGAAPEPGITCRDSRRRSKARRDFPTDRENKSARSSRAGKDGWECRGDRAGLSSARNQRRRYKAHSGDIRRRCRSSRRAARQARRSYRRRGTPRSRGSREPARRPEHARRIISLLPDRGTQGSRGSCRKTAAASSMGSRKRRTPDLPSLRLLLGMRSYRRRAGGIGETGNNLGRHRLRLDRARLRRIGRRPDTLFESLEGERAGVENAMAHGEAAPPPLADFALDDDLVIEAARLQETGADLDDRHADDAVFPAHRRRRQAGALEEPTGAGIEDNQILRVKNDPGGIALSPLDAQLPPVGQHGAIGFLDRLSF